MRRKIPLMFVVIKYGTKVCLILRAIKKIIFFLKREIILLYDLS